MKRQRYIASLLLLLFVTAFGSKFSLSQMCSCNEHHDVHICCHCATHALDCGNHTQSFSKLCVAHHSDLLEFFDKASFERGRSLSIEAVEVAICDRIEECKAPYVEYMCSDRMVLYEPDPPLILGGLRAPPVLV